MPDLFMMLLYIIVWLIAVFIVNILAKKFIFRDEGNE
jgi:hypothetical protein